GVPGHPEVVEARKGDIHLFRRRRRRTLLHGGTAKKMNVPFFQANIRNSQTLTPAISAEPGIVRIHAQTTRPATPQRTDRILFREPTPTIAPVMVCVVLIGMPLMIVVMASVRAAPVSAEKPSTGRKRLIRCPIVLTIR